MITDLLKSDMTFIPNTTQIDEANSRIPHKEEFKRFGMSVEFTIRDYLIKSGEVLDFSPDLYAPYDWSQNNVWYDVKCSTSGATHTISSREKNEWYDRLKQGLDTIIISTKRDSINSAKFNKFIYFNDLVKNRLIALSHKIPGTYYFYY